MITSSNGIEQDLTVAADPKVTQTGNIYVFSWVGSSFDPTQKKFIGRYYP